MAPGIPGFFVSRPELPFLSRFPGFSVPGGITYRFCRKTPLNRKSRENKVVRDFRTTKDDYLMAGNKTLKNYENIFGNQKIIPIFVPGFGYEPNRPGGFRGTKND